MLEHITITINESVPESISNVKLVDLCCKHAIKDTKIAELIDAYSKEIGYEWAIWGSHSNNTSVEYHSNRIAAMETADYRHAVRIVICKYDFSDKQYIWTDNLHSTIRYLRQYGLDTKVKDIPFYIIDLSDFNNPIISSKKEYLHTDFQSICGALSNAYKRFYWSDNEKLMNLHYTVGAFLQDNEILLSKMN